MSISYVVLHNIANSARKLKNGRSVEAADNRRCVKGASIIDTNAQIVMLLFFGKKVILVIKIKKNA